VARRYAEIEGCIALKSHVDDAWGSALETVLRAPSLTTWSTGYANCETDLPGRVFGAEIASLATRVDAYTARFVYLSASTMGAATLDASLHPPPAPGLQLREQASPVELQAWLVRMFTVSGRPIRAGRTFSRATRRRRSVARWQIVWRAVVSLSTWRLAIAGQAALRAAVGNLQRQVVWAYAISMGPGPRRGPGSSSGGRGTRWEVLPKRRSPPAARRAGRSYLHEPALRTLVPARAAAHTLP
jgi:hypothetical protein